MASRRRFGRTTSALAPVAPWFIMPSGEIHYASNAPAVRFQTSAAPSDARRVRHWLAVARLEHQSNLASSAGGQSRNMRRPVYVSPKPLKPIYTGDIEMIEVGRAEPLKPKPPEPSELAWLEEFVEEAGTNLYKFFASGFLTSNPAALAGKLASFGGQAYGEWSKLSDGEKAFWSQQAANVSPQMFEEKVQQVATYYQTKTALTAASGTTSLKDVAVSAAKLGAGWCVGGVAGLPLFL